MLDPVNALGLASNILSFIDFSWGVIKGTSEIYYSATGTTSENAHVASVISDLAKAAEGLVPDVEAKTKHSKALSELAQKCSALSTDLLQILERLQVTGKGSKRQSLKIKLRSVLKENKVASIEKRLDKYRTEIILQLNLMLNEQHSSFKRQLDKIEEESSRFSTESAKGFSTLRNELETAVRSLSQQSQQFPNGTYTAGTGTATSFEEISVALSNLQSMAGLMPRETQILRRLHFRSMHSRGDTMETAESGTFSWLVESEDDSDVQAGLSSGTTNNAAEVDGTGVTLQDKLKKDQARASFQDWLEFGSGVYHISGKAGSGKSTLMKFLSSDKRVCHKLQSWAGGKKLVFAQSFFWNSGDKLQMSIEGLYRTLLFEILKLCPELIPHIFPELWRRSGPGTVGVDDEVSIRFPELEAAFNALIQTRTFAEHRFCFFLDGLDEYEGDSVQHWELARKLQQWATSSDIKFCVSSRPHTEFMDTFSDDPNLRIRLHEVTSNDIRQFATSMFEKDVNFNQVSEVYLELVQRVVDDANGVFLWARLVVRSLLEGVGQRYPASALWKRLATAPKDLCLLFDQMLARIDPADRTLSVKIFLLAIYNTLEGEFHDDWGELELEEVGKPLNALIYTWLEDLENPSFPFNAPVCGYSDAEIVKRHEVMRCHIDGLSRGLLEMVPIKHADLYFKYEVQFFHRTVRDYLEEPLRRKEFQDRVPNFTPVDDYFRLRLAEFKFARTSWPLFTYMDSPMFGVLDNTIWRLTGSARCSERLSFDILDGFGTALESHRRLPFSHPEEVGRNPGLVYWGAIREIRIRYDKEKRRAAIVRPAEFSYLHYLSRLGLAGYVRAKVDKQNELLKPCGTLSLLLSALRSRRGTNTLVLNLLEAGADPNAYVDVYFGEEGPKTHGTASVWMVFLGRMASYIPTSKFPGEKAKKAEYVENLLEFGADVDVFMLLSLGPPSEPSTVESGKVRTRKEEERLGDQGQEATAPAEHDGNRVLCSLSVEELMRLIKPDNLEVIQRLLHKESLGWWKRPWRAISSLGGHGTDSVGAQKYKSVKAEDLRSREFHFHSVCSKTTQLRYPFEVNLS